MEMILKFFFLNPFMKNGHRQQNSDCYKNNIVVFYYIIRNYAECEVIKEIMIPNIKRATNKFRNRILHLSSPFFPPHFFSHYVP